MALYGFGRLTEEMAALLKRVCAGKEIWDLGCGHGHLSLFLAGKCDVRKVVAIDSNPLIDSILDHPLIETRGGVYFKDVEPPPEGIDIALVSWPSNGLIRGIVPLLKAANEVIYLGKNTDGLACGTPSFWAHMLKRHHIVSVPHYRNAMSVYGPYDENSKGDTFRTGEECGGIDLMRLYSFEAAWEMAGYSVGRGEDNTFLPA